MRCYFFVAHRQSGVASLQQIEGSEEKKKKNRPGDVRKEQEGKPISEEERSDGEVSAVHWGIVQR